MYGLRSARITLTAPGKPSFTLFPMIHVAEVDFFARVRSDAATYDLVLYEGPEESAGVITTFLWRWFASGSVDLAFQLDHLRGGEFRNGRMADMNLAEIKARWRRLPYWARLGSTMLTPVRWFMARCAGPRRLLVEGLDSVYDVDGTRHVTEEDGAYGQFIDLILNQRDAIVAAHCDRAIAESVAERIAVIYGAGHMPALIQHLYRKHGYRPVRAEWLMAIAA